MAMKNDFRLATVLMREVPTSSLLPCDVIYYSENDDNTKTYGPFMVVMFQDNLHFVNSYGKVFAMSTSYKTFWKLIPGFAIEKGEQT